MPLLLLLFFAFPKAKTDLENVLVRNLEGVMQKQAELIKMWLNERKHESKIITKNISTLFENTLSDNDFSSLSEYMEKIKTEYGYKTIYVVSLDGNIVVSTGKTAERSNILEYDYCRKALEGNIFTSDIKYLVLEEHAERAVESYVIFLSVPLVNSDYSLLGAVIFGIDTTPLNEILKSLKLGTTGETFLVNREGYMVTESRFLDELKNAGLIRKSTIFELEVLNPRTGTHTEGVKKCLSGIDGYDTNGYINYNGSKVLGAWCWIPDINCGLLTQINIQEGYETAYGLKNFVLSMLMVLAFPLTLAAFYFSKRITSPLYKITEVTKKITSGDLGQRVIYKGRNDEIGKLAKEFNVMAASLEEKTIKLRNYTIDLENKVKERTLKLQSTTNFLNSILAGSTEYSIIAQDLSGNILAFNKGASLIYGYRQEEMIGVANIRKLHVEDDIESGKVDYILDKALKTGRFEGEVMKRRKNGEIFPVHNTVTLRRDENGKPIGFVVISKDITKAKLVTLEKDIINNINKTIASGIDIKEVYQVVFRELKRMIDLTWLNIAYFLDGSEIIEESNIVEGELLTKDWLGIRQLPGRKMVQDIVFEKEVPVFVADTSKGEYAIDKKLYEKEVNSYLCFPLKSKGKSIGTLTLGSYKKNTFKEMHFDLLNQVTSQIAITIENARLFLSIKESEKKYRDLVENAPEMIHEIHPEGEFVDVNKTELNKLGYSIEEMKRMKLEDIVPVGSQDEIRRHINLIKDTGSSELETVFLTKSGNEMNVEIHGTGFYNRKTGECMFIREFVRDISERKRMEEQVRRSEKLASMGELAAAIAHEIRNPLGAICNSVGILDSRLKLSGQDKDLLEMIVGESERLDRIISDFLSFAHPREPSFALQDIKGIIKNTIFLLGQDKRFTDKIEIKEIYESVLPKVYIDTDLIHQILWNLFINSLDAMPNGGRIRVVVRKTTLFLRNAIEIIISDNGIGMTDHEINKVFEPFYTTKSEGTGLGLSVVQRIIDEHGGAIDVKSKYGKGTTFYIKLPVVNEKQTVQSNLLAG
ncbi:MAG: PAS domain S-box protein [Candidatus Kuenenia sp.]|nr:PAS domain S-box protein [Candidatus Kuenenia hertensis]